MEKLIERLTELTLSGNMYPKSKQTDFDRTDLFLPEHLKQAKRIHDYIMAQEPVLTEYQAMTGSFTYSGPVLGDAHGRNGHKSTAEAMSRGILPSRNRICIQALTLRRLISLCAMK